MRRQAQPWRPRLIATPILVAAALTTATCLAAGAAIDLGSLAAGAVHSGSLTAEQRSDHQIAIDAGQAAELKLRLIDGAGIELRWAGAAQPPLQTDAGRGAVVRRTLIAGPDTRWQVSVAPFPSDDSVSYALSLGAAHSATDADRHRATAEEAFAQAQALRQSGAKDAGPRLTTLYQDAIDAWEKAGDPCGLRIGYVGQALYRIAAADFANAAASATSALRQRCDVDLAEQARAERALGVALSKQGDVSAAVKAQERALALYRKTADIHNQSLVLGSLSEGYRALGEPGKALEAAQSALQLAQGSDDSRNVAFAHHRIAANHLVRGELMPALAMYRQALDDLRKAPSPEIEGAVWSDLGTIYRRLGDRDEANQAWAKAETVCTATANWSCVASAALDRGDALIDDGKPADAAKSYQRALDVARAHEVQHEQVSAQGGLGRAALALRHWPEARTRLDAAQKGFHDMQDLVGEARARVALGDLANRQRTLATAQRDYAQALALARQAGDEDTRIVALASLARVALQYGEPGEARRYIEQAVAAIEAQRAQFDDPGLRSSYFTATRAYYALNIEILMQLERGQSGRGYADAALVAAERARARALQEQLTAGRIAIDPQVAPELLDEERSAADRVRIATGAAQQLSSKSAADERTRALAELDEANRQLDTARGRIRNADPRYAELAHPVPLTEADHRRSLLVPDEAVLEYWLGEPHSYAWLVTRGSVRGYELPARAAIESVAAQLLQKLITPPPRHTDVPTEHLAPQQAEEASAVRNLARKLGAMLLKQTASLPKGANVAIVGDGILQRVPFAYLVAGAAADAPAFGASHGIAMLPSIETLRWLRRTPVPAGGEPRVAIFADPVFRADDPRLHRNPSVAESPAVNESLLRAASDLGSDLRRLPNSREEAEAIAAIASHEPWMALDFDASRDAVLKAPWSEYTIAHFASHALLDLRHPELSGVVLSLYDASGSAADGFLRLGDLYKLRMPVDLVVLSACESTPGRDVGADGMFGLSRAFFYAGARRVVSSLWTVDDRASAQFMRYFYASLIGQKLAPQAALHRAQGQMARDPQWQAPHYWAGFVLQGDWR
jgi:CHAT domain-containing protein